MAWRSHYVNCDKLYGINESEQDVCLMYDSKVPPHGGIRREWNTVGMKHGTAKILFVEYTMEDDDPDGVWEAYGMKAESEYSFTVNAKQADPAKLFVYTLYKDGRFDVGFDIDTEQADAILVFAQPQELDAELLIRATQKAKEVLRSFAVTDIVKNDILKGSNVTCLAIFNL